MASQTGSAGKTMLTNVDLKPYLDYVFVCRAGAVDRRSD